MAEYSLRFMTVEDIDDVLIVEHDAFTVPWTRTAFYNELTNNRFAHYIVLEVNGTIIGYCGLWVIHDESHITNIAIHSDYRGKKLGEYLLIHVMEFAQRCGAKKMTLEARVSNVVALNLYKKIGFVEGGIRKNYYTDNQEDAKVMWVKLNEERKYHTSN